MAFHDYLVGEVAEEYGEGLLSRREALRRLVMLGLAVPSATAILAACGGSDDDSSAEASASPASPAATAQTTPVPGGGDPITFKGKDGDVKGAVLVMHENKGLTSHFYDLVGRFAKEGYTALCVDLVSRAGGADKFSDPAAATAELNKLTDDQILDDLKAGLDELEKRAKDARIGAIGFCFGGGTTWKLLADGESRIDAACPFYGRPGEGDDAYDFGKTKAAVLAVYAGDDERVNATREAAEKGLKDAGLTYEVKTFDGAQHAFFNDTGPRYDAQAAEEAWNLVLDWFADHLS
jgi:carboxymethylenebutenolidase